MAKFEYGSYDSSVENGVFTDSTYTNPANETETRKQLSYPLEEVKNQINKMLTSGNDSVLLNVTANSIQYSTNDGASWTPVTVQTSGQAVNGLPEGGADGQYLTKNGSSDFQAQWTTLPHEIPTGGTNGQYLAKNGSANYSLKWITPPESSYTAGAGISLVGGIIANTGLLASARTRPNEDLNTILDSGTYYVSTTSTALASTYHYPAGINGLLIVSKISSVVYRQFFFRVGTVSEGNDYYWFSRQINTGVSNPAVGEWAFILNSKLAPVSATASVDSGDRILVSDSSDSNNMKMSSIYFDGSTTNQYLTKAGTWGSLKPSMTLLWTNSNTASAFSAQTVSIGASAYNMIYIETYNSVDRQFFGIPCLCAKGQTTGSSYSGTYRTFAFNSAGTLTISNGSDGQSTNNNYVIPYRVWGIG